jgi:hypothetical protein
MPRAPQRAHRAHQGARHREARLVSSEFAAVPWISEVLELDAHGYVPTVDGYVQVARALDDSGAAVLRNREEFGQ